jgi:hypothetical protein
MVEIRRPPVPQPEQTVYKEQTMITDPHTKEYYFVETTKNWTGIDPLDANSRGPNITIINDETGQPVEANRQTMGFRPQTINVPLEQIMPRQRVISFEELGFKKAKPHEPLPQPEVETEKIKKPVVTLERTGTTRSPQTK